MKERALYIDATKGVAILCIAFLHFEQGVIPAWLNVWIGMFMITAFYFTSGWVSGIQKREIRTKELFRKRVKQLGVPYLWFSALIILFDICWVACGFMESNILLRDIYKTMTLRGIGTLWFLPVLVIGETIFCYIKNRKHKWLYTLIGMLLVFLATHLYYGVWGPMRNISTINQLIDAPLQPIVRGIQSWPIIATGYITAKYLWPRFAQLNKIIITTTALAAITFSISLIIAPIFNIYYLNKILSNTLPVFGFICLFFVMGNKNFFSRFFIYWGVNSLILMCTHYSIVQEIFMTLDKRIIHTGFTGIATIIYFVITIIITYPIVWLFNTKLKFMLGRK